MLFSCLITIHVPGAHDALSASAQDFVSASSDQSNTFDRLTTPYSDRSGTSVSEPSISSTSSALPSPM